MDDHKLQIRLRAPVALWVRAWAVARGETATTLVERAVLAALAAEPPQSRAGLTIRGLGFRPGRGGDQC